MPIRCWLALWLGKIISKILKILGKKGTTLPGAVARKVYPDLIGTLASFFPEGTIIVTGTNGKTTTNNLLAAILKSAGKSVAFNREGANMLTGIAVSMLQNISFTGKPLASVLLLEVDEATVPLLCRELSPRYAVVTNFFRDQLDRYGELDTTIKLVKDALPQTTGLILNADDPLVAQIGCDRPDVVFFGTESLPVSHKSSSEPREGRYCFRCGQELSYAVYHYGQLGVYYCASCGFKRPEPDIEARAVRRDEQGISFTVEGESFLVPLQGYYNLYNGLAAFSAADRLGISREKIKQGLAGFAADAGRMEPFSFSGCRVILTLVKNPTGFNQVLHTAIETNKPLRLLIAINDLAADGRDISWLWDVDFEILLSGATVVKEVVCSGLRAEDMALRLKYAGFKAEQIAIIKDIDQAAELFLRNGRAGGEALYILPTYTALFPMREALLQIQSKKRREDNETRNLPSVS